MHRVHVFDTTLRDGEQSPGATMTPAEKLRVAHQLDSLGVDVIEAGFPASSPAELGAVREIAREVRRPTIAALARATDSDVDAAGAALEPAERSRIHIFLATSPIHLRHKLRITEDECVERAMAAVRRACRHVDEVEFSAEDATRTPLDFLCRVVAAAVEAGATIVNLPDTVGYSYPAEMQRMFEAVRSCLPADVLLSAHCHDDLGLAVANTLAALEAGARQVECTINGIGERAGNAALEEVVMALRTRRDGFPFETRVDSTQLHRASRLVAHVTGIHPQPNKAVVGRNAFAHEAGIHQDGVLKERSTYEIMTPESVGARETSLVLGRHSGRNALSQRYRALGYELDDAALGRAYNLFKQLCDQKKTILDEDLIAILHHGTMESAPQRFRLRGLEVRCGTSQAAARVQLAVDGRETESLAEGDGPLAAVFAAVEAVSDHHIELQQLSIEAITPGGDAVGEVMLQARIDAKTFTGTGAATDIVTAATRAYLHALNKASHARTLEAEALERASKVWGV